MPDLRLPGRRRKRSRLLRLRCWLLQRRPLRLPLVLTTLLLLPLRQVVADYAPGRRSDDGMMTGHMPGEGANRCTLQATPGLGCACAEEHANAGQSRNQHLSHVRLHGHTPGGLSWSRSFLQRGSAGWQYEPRPFAMTGGMYEPTRACKDAGCRARRGVNCIPSCR